MSKTKFITDTEIYKEVILEQIPKAQEFLWLGTSDLKDLYVNKNGKMVPFLEILSGLVKRKVSIRLIHAKEPGPAFRRDFDKYPNLIKGMERILCPRVHFKSVIVDGRFAYTGSANLTGAGMGAKSIHRRKWLKSAAFPLLISSGLPEESPPPNRWQFTRARLRWIDR